MREAEKNWQKKKKKKECRMIEIRHSDWSEKEMKREQRKKKIPKTKKYEKKELYYTSSYTFIPITQLNLIQQLNNRRTTFCFTKR